MNEDRLIWRTGSVLGHKHREKGINNQDAYYLSPDCAVDSVAFPHACVLDGCTNEYKGRRNYSRNEAGAILLADFIESEIPLLLAARTLIDDLPGVLYQRCVGHLGSIARMSVAGTPQKMWDFIQRRLLTTICGFVMGGEITTAFSAGDGIIIINDEVIVVGKKNDAQGMEIKNQPDYLAYHLFDKRMLPKGYLLPTNFEVHSFKTETINRLAVSTDGLRKAWENDHGIIENLWSYEPEAPAGLQWWLNGTSEEGLFEDDVTVVAIQRKLSKEVSKTCS